MAWTQRGRLATSEDELGPVRGRTTRRRLRITAAVLALALLTAACTGDTATPEGEGGDADDGGSAEVDNPGVFVHALGGEPESLDPAAATDGGFGNRAIIQMY